jgi:methylated-DNA-protein-cysteine methyltransferase related protein
MEEVNDDFRQRVYAYVAQIPRGRVMTYGQLAALAGSPYAARIVGGIAHWGDPDLPWQRVVKKDGSLAEGYPGGTEGHRAALAAEGVEFSDEYKLDIGKLLWRPPNPNQNSLL